MKSRGLQYSNDFVYLLIDFLFVKIPLQMFDILTYFASNTAYFAGRVMAKYALLLIISHVISALCHN